MKKHTVNWLFTGVIVVLGITILCIPYNRKANPITNPPNDTILYTPVTEAQPNPIDTIVLQDEEADTTTISSTSRSLNDIRFENWTEEDWYDNDYFRALSTYIDDWLEGKVDNKELEPYKSALKGSKFIIGDASPAIFGGMFVSIVFLNAPNVIFETHIYSGVDEDTEEITDYEVRGLRVSDRETGWTKEDLLTLLKEHPENKLW